MKLLTNIVLVLALICGTVSSSCQTGNNGQSLQTIEQMSDVEFDKWKLYIQLGVKIGANRLLEEKTVTVDDLLLASTAIETLRDQSIRPGIDHVIGNALIDSGLKNDEVALLLMIVEDELKARGALTWTDTVSGLIRFSPRTKDLLTTVVSALRSATIISTQDAAQGKQLQVYYGGKLMKN